MKPQVTFQIGKNGITQEVIEALHPLFKNYQQVRISLLKSSGRDRDSIEAMGQDIAERLTFIDNRLYTFRKIGFTLIFKQGSIKNKKI